MIYATYFGFTSTMLSHKGYASTNPEGLMDIGDNSVMDAAGQLVEYVNDLVSLHRTKTKLKENRKTQMEVFKDHELPGSVILALAKADPDKLADKAAKLKLAGSILAKPVYAEEIEPVPTADLELNESVVQSALEAVEAIQGIDEELEGVKEDTKETFAAAKGAGFSKPILLRMVAYKLDPQAWMEHNALESAYKRAIDSVTSPLSPA
jgi:uncharacterized protein (UPF0335 family)